MNIQNKLIIVFPPVYIHMPLLTICLWIDAIGNIFHELSHFVVAILVRAKVNQFVSGIRCYRRNDCLTMRLRGHINASANRLQEVLITFAPVILSILMVWYSYWSLLLLPTMWLSTSDSQIIFKTTTFGYSGTITHYYVWTILFFHRRFSFPTSMAEDFGSETQTKPFSWETT